MKIVQINTVLGIGSTGSIVENLCYSSKEKGMECLIAYGRGIAKDEIDCYRISGKFSYYLNVLHTRMTGNDIHSAKKDTIRMIKKIREFSPDVIHLHNIHGYYLDYEILFNFLKELNVPVIWTLHDCYPFTGHCTYPTLSDCYDYMTGCKNCTQKHRYPKSMFFNTAEKSFKIKENLFNSVKRMHIVTPSQWLANCLENSFLKEFPVSVIPNGIDEEVFKPVNSDFKEKSGLSDKFIIFAAASLWGEAKGLNILLKLSELIPSDMQIVIVGVTEKQKNSFPENITGILKTNNKQELAMLYSMADVFINPTLSDNFPTVNLEALACGTPIITSDIGGASEAVDPSCGIVVKTGDTEGFLNAVLKIRENPKKKEDCLKKAVLFYKSEMYKKYNELYSSFNK